MFLDAPDAGWRSKHLSIERANAANYAKRALKIGDDRTEREASITRRLRDTQ